MPQRSILASALALAGNGPGRERRAWSIVWEAMRYLQRGAATVRFNRIDSLDPTQPGEALNAEHRIAAQCIRAVAPKPVHGEAAVAAAFENAADLARSVADRLYDSRRGSE